MPTPRKPRLHGQAQRTVRATLDRLGGELRRSRTARRLTQRQLAERAGLSQSTISDIELGHGGSLSLDTWQRVAIALGHHLRIALGRDPLELPADAGHLDIQELILRLSPRGMTMRTFELNSRSRDSALSTDVGLVATAARRLVLIECINTIGDLGAAAAAPTGSGARWRTWRSRWAVIPRGPSTPAGSCGISPGTGRWLRATPRSSRPGFRDRRPAGCGRSPRAIPRRRRRA